VTLLQFLQQGEGLQLHSHHMTTVMGHDNNRNHGSDNNDTSIITPCHKTQDDIATTATATATQHDHVTMAMAMILSRAHNCQFDSRYVVTARTATPTKVDSKLSDTHLESLKRREGKGNATKARSLE
jgi:hypothetical protein